MLSSRHLVCVRDKVIKGKAQLNQFLSIFDTYLTAAMY